MLGKSHRNQSSESRVFIFIRGRWRNFGLFSWQRKWRTVEWRRLKSEVERNESLWCSLLMLMAGINEFRSTARTALSHAFVIITNPKIEYLAWKSANRCWLDSASPTNCETHRSHRWSVAWRDGRSLVPFYDAGGCAAINLSLWWLHTRKCSLNWHSIKARTAR